LIGAASVLAVVKPGPLVVAAAILAAVAWRWRRLSTANRVLSLLAVLGLGAYGGGLVRPPSPEDLILGLGQTLGPYTYVLVGALAFLEVGAFVGLVVPGEFTVIFGGVVAGQGVIDIGWLIGLVWACAVAGDTTSYLLGRRLGRDFMLRHGPRVKITRERLERVEGFFEQHGGKTILFGRFIGLVRAMAPFIAGASRMPLRRFAPYDIVSAGLWSATFCLLGYVFWQSFDQVVRIARQGAFALGLVLALVVGGFALYRYLRVADNRRRAREWLEAQSRRPAIRPLSRSATAVQRRVLAPVGRAGAGPARFVWQRLTPGELGLELTTLLAIALVGAFVFGQLASDVSDQRAFLADGRATDLAGAVRSQLGVDAAIAVTALGSGQVVGAVVALAASFLLARREVVEGVTLLVASLVTHWAVNLIKSVEARPRPPGGLVETQGASFPSGHAAYSVAYVAVVVALVRALPSFTGRVALVVGAIALAALIGLTRVLLEVHYLSDVLAGWGLSAAIFAGLALLAMVVAYIRHNGARA